MVQVRQQRNLVCLNCDAPGSILNAAAQQGCCCRDLGSPPCTANSEPSTHFSLIISVSMQGVEDWLFAVRLQLNRHRSPVRSKCYVCLQFGSTTMLRWLRALAAIYAGHSIQ